MINSTLTIISILLYLHLGYSFLKPLPALLLATTASTDEVIWGLMASALGDIVLEFGWLEFSLIPFGICHYLLLRSLHLFQMKIPWILILLLSQLFWIYPNLPVILYSWILGTLLWNLPQSHSRFNYGVVLYTLADLLIFLHLVDPQLNMGRVSLLIYWGALWLISS